MSPPGSFLLQITSDDSIVEETLRGLTPVSEDQHEYSHLVEGLCPGRTYLVSVAGDTPAGNGPSASIAVTTVQRGERERAKGHAQTEIQGEPGIAIITTSTYLFADPSCADMMPHSPSSSDPHQHGIPI